MLEKQSDPALRVPGAPITLASVRKTYGATTVLHDIDLDIAPGEFMTLLGPSGSGKTTTLGLIAGLISLSSGTLEIDGRDVGSVPMYKRGIGVVFQNYALFPHMTVFENVAFPLKQRGVKKADAATQVRAALDTVRLSGLEARYPSELSGGQQQRVAFARSIVFRPRVLLMDEPLGALDKKLRDWLQLEIRRIHAEVGSTFVYVTHDQDEALSMSDRVAVFNNGRIEQVGTPEELYNAPRTLFVAQFIGESTTISGVVAARNDQTVDVLGADRWQAPAPASYIDGERVALLVRPEHIRVLPPTSEPADGRVNRTRAVVEDFIYLGTGYRCKFRLPDGTEGVARIPSTDGAVAPIGGEAMVEWDIAHGVVLPEAPSAAATVS